MTAQVFALVRGAQRGVTWSAGFGAFSPPSSAA